MKRVKVTIAIPAYNTEKTIEESIKSCLSQDYKEKEILIVDDGSTDGTVDIIKKYSEVRLVCNGINLGIGKNIVKLMNEARGKYVVYLCADDVFTNSQIVSDIAKIFDSNAKIGVIARYYYQYMNGFPGAIMTCRDMNIFTNVCNPSGVALRKKSNLTPSNKIFIEMPSVVAQYLDKHEWTIMEYDTIAARIHPGGNTGTKESYYKGSQIENWVSLVGDSFRFNQGFIQIKNRAPKMLWQEIKMAWNLTPGVRTELSFWVCVIIALLTPSCILRQLSNFYRHRISRHFCTIIERGENE